MDFWKDIWRGIVAPFIVISLSPIAIAIGNRIITGKWNFPNQFLNIIYVWSYNIIVYFIIIIIIVWILSMFIDGGWGKAIARLNAKIDELMISANLKK